MNFTSHTNKVINLMVAYCCESIYSYLQGEKGGGCKPRNLRLEIYWKGEKFKLKKKKKEKVVMKI